MNYIIHNPTNHEMILPQIQTCILAAPPCAPDCDECFERIIENHINRLREAGEEMYERWLEPYRQEYLQLVEQQERATGISQPEPCLDPGVGESEIVLTPLPDTLPKAELDLAYSELKRLNAESTAARLQEENDILNRWKNEMMQLLGQTDFQEAGKLMGLHVGDSVLEKLIPWIKEVKARAEELTTIWDKFEPVAGPLIAAAIALEKEADYLHPYSGEVADVVERFRAAVINYKKADEKA